MRNKTDESSIGNVEFQMLLGYSKGDVQMHRELRARDISYGGKGAKIRLLIEAWSMKVRAQKKRSTQKESVTKDSHSPRDM